jgi:hypothetical protein
MPLLPPVMTPIFPSNRRTVFPFMSRSVGKTFISLSKQSAKVIGASPHVPCHILGE